ncbi:tyrosine-protein kinase, active site protein [Pochonia chlamydosporia 170]|uniref:EKC/KEOPS complex subunit BUD32 n=1 Tax=Pochonia chlamydosporia 170 TaxID=1380566 RepID=A0A179G519_METCM|nr:tyrosine-protein kinase, active site protein [Pochonia chlamydosporia 170]OAQ72453.1 tyrosine-protein kinase, active site protein [Pochonia chlamydosporia 170]
MDLSQQSIHDVIHPTAAFSTFDGVNHVVGATPTLDTQSSWDDSLLNPKNRFDSLCPPKNPLWRIDGCTAFGTQIYAVPLFVDKISPFRVDVFIPEPATLPADVRDALDLDVTFYTRDRARISRLGITSHVLRCLQYWSSTQKDPMGIYDNLPFGSRIVFQNLPKAVSKALISVVPTHYLERQLLSVSSLTKNWGEDIDIPPTVDINDVVYLSQLHDSVCLVDIGGKTWIFKALTSYTKYLYHELRQLLKMPSHPNVISRPVHLVTKKCSFGNKTAVIGFTLEYHVYGSLRDLIPFMQLHGQVSLADKTKWSLQLASALLHLHHVAHFFYPDLRLDNIVLSESSDAIMVDFEQRGVWCEFAAPEVNAIEYIRLLAIDEEIDPDIRDKYADILSEMLPGWERMGQGEEYIWPSKGYNVPWACLTRTEEEACEVYMLGRVLWCIFEASSAPQRAAVWLSYPWEPLVEFPGYTTTPKPIRELIDACTRGRQVGLSKHIVRKQKKLVMRELENTDESTAEQVQQIASDWWTKEIEFSEKWLKQRADGMKSGNWNENYYNRPSLQQVHDALNAFKQQNGYSF